MTLRRRSVQWGDIRRLFASEYVGGPDPQVRIVILAPLRQFARLTKDCVVVGADTRIEIWDAEAWDSYVASTEQSFVELDGEVVPPA